MNAFQSKKQKVKRIQIQKLKTKKRKTKNTNVIMYLNTTNRLYVLDL